jgi:hypothetical protein
MSASDPKRTLPFVIDPIIPPVEAILRTALPEML